ncbi:MAG TPA: hypothetical protein GXX23_01130 [Firmicutes bacterium]|nr:hypothetical protein [Candidatus Fermentithermobacillaceae bacterium]
MLRRVFCITAAVVLVLILGVTSVAAAPAQTDRRADWKLRNQPFPVKEGWGWKPWKGTGLDYYLYYSQETNEITMYVVNDTRKSITVTTPTAMVTDFALWKDGQLVWRDAADKSYAQTVTTVTFKPGEGKAYKAKLPAMAQGTYFVQAYFVGETTAHPVAATYIWMRAQEPVEYTIEFLPANWFNNTPRLRVTIKNTSGKDLKLPYQYGYQILVKVAGAKEYLGNVGIGQSLGTLEAGATRTIFVPLRGLSRGTYQADVRSNLTGGAYRVVESTWFWIP